MSKIDHSVCLAWVTPYTLIACSFLFDDAYFNVTKNFVGRRKVYSLKSAIYVNKKRVLDCTTYRYDTFIYHGC